MIKRLQTVKDRIQTAARACGRNPETIRLVAVTKTVPTARVRQAILAGVTILGENYVQEARTKFNDLATTPVSWHFIGHLQSNKAKYAVRLFDLIHSVDSLKLARELDKQSRNINKIQDRLKILSFLLKSYILSSFLIFFLKKILNYSIKKD